MINCSQCKITTAVIYVIFLGDKLFTQTEDTTSFRLMLVLSSLTVVGNMSHYYVCFSS